MKNIFFLLFFLAYFHSFGQINNSDILVIIVEEEKDTVDHTINWNKVNNEFQKKLQDVVADRENLRAYYESLYFNYQNYFITHPIESKVTSMNELTYKINEYYLGQCENRYVLLTGGMIKPSAFLPELRKIYLNFNRWRNAIRSTETFLINTVLSTNENVFSKMVYYNDEITIYGMLFRGAQKLNISNFFSFIKEFYTHGHETFKKDYEQKKEQDELLEKQRIEEQKKNSSENRNHAH